MDRTNKRSFIVAGFSAERFLVSVFPASEKFDSDSELDAGMHKTERATRDMMGNVGAPFNFHHKRIVNLVVVSCFTGNAKLTAPMISFFSRSVTLYVSYILNSSSIRASRLLTTRILAPLP